MIGISEPENINNLSTHDFDLGIPGFKYSDLFDAYKLKELAEKFYSEIEEKEPVLHQALTKYIGKRGIGYEPKVASKILTDSAPFLSEFVANMFGVNKEREELEREILKDNPIWRYKFFVQRRAIRTYKEEKLADYKETELSEAIRQLKKW